MFVSLKPIFKTACEYRILAVAATVSSPSRGLCINLSLSRSS